MATKKDKVEKKGKGAPGRPRKVRPGQMASTNKHRKWTPDMDDPAHRLRMSLIMTDLKRGLLCREIAEKYAEEWGITATTISNQYLPYARDLIKADLANITTDLRSEQLAKYLELYRIAMENGSIKNANSILNSIDKLFGLQTQKVETEIKNIQISFE